jgi:hypothetical protein
MHKVHGGGVWFIPLHAELIVDKKVPSDMALWIKQDVG